MGQKQHKHKKKYENSSNEKEEEDEYNNKNTNDNNNDKNSDNNKIEDDNTPEDSPEDYEYENIIKKLKHMNLSEQEVEDNYEFYKANYEKLIKINKIINKIKKTNLYNLTPFEILAKLVPENEIKILPPEYDSLENKKEIFNEAPINPEYVLPSKWEDLFELKISDKALDKLYISSEIQKVIKNYSEWKGESCEKWGKRINEDNYEIFELEVKNFIRNHNNNFEKLKIMNLSEEDIEDNLWFYYKNCEKLIKINDMINNIDSSNLNKLSPQEVLAKIVPESELKIIDSNKASDNDEEKNEINDLNSIKSEYVLPPKWEDLFELEISDKVLDKLYIYSQIQKLVILYADWKGEICEKGEKIINEDNYKDYETEIKNFIKDNKNSILEKLKFMNLSEEDIEDKFWFYYKTCEKLIKINDIINNINSSFFNNLSPQEVLDKIVPESELKNNNSDEDSNDYEEEENENYEKTQICPEYAVPSKWDDLFRLEISDKTLDKLYLESKIMKLATEFSLWKNENIEKWLFKINKYNYQEYEEELEAQKNELSFYDKMKKVITEINSLEYFYINEEEIRSNIEYYYKNLKEIIKIDNIIKNAKIGNLYYLTPSEAYRKVTGDNPDHLNLPDKWEDLFNLEVPEWNTNILFATTKNNIKNKEFETNRIESNREVERYYNKYGIKNKENNERNKKVMDKKTLVNEIKKLKYYKVKESEIKNNYEYYLNKFEELKKINTIIENAKKAKIYNKSPGHFIKHQKGFEYSFPKKWEDLFNMKSEFWKINMLYDCTSEYLERRGKEINDKKDTIIKELKNLKNFDFNKNQIKIKNNLGYYMDHLDEIKKIDEIISFASETYKNSKGPKWLYEKYYEVNDDITLPNKWLDLFNLNWSTNKLNDLYIATKVERLKYYFNEFALEKNLDYDYYDKTIKIYNYKEYEEDFDKYIANYKRLDKIKSNILYIRKHIEEDYSDSDKDQVEEDIKTFNEKNLNAKSNLNPYDKYEKEFERVSKQIKKERARKRREERENRNYNSNSRSNYSSSSASNNSDLKKCFVKLCQKCKNSCVDCKKVIKGGEIHTGKPFGLHKKCQINSCYICGTSKNSDHVCERQVSYLCKSCYNAFPNLDWTKCISCHKHFK